MKKVPTVFHITNHKAGSQWVAEILKHAAPERFVKPQTGVRHFFEHPIKLGHIYPTIYVPKPLFSTTLKGYNTQLVKHDVNFLRSFFASIANSFSFRFRNNPYKIFVIVRDLRDILVSHYFSLKVSHPVTRTQIMFYRENLNSLSKDDGLIFLMKEIMILQSQIQQSWYNDCNDRNVLLVRFEDLIKDEQFVFTQIVSHCEIDINPRHLHDIVKGNSFQVSTGRHPGQEDIQAHLRKGIAGDWKNHFADQVRHEFKQRFGQLLIDTGYEKDLNW